MKIRENSVGRSSIVTEVDGKTTGKFQFKLFSFYFVFSFDCIYVEQ